MIHVDHLYTDSQKTPMHNFVYIFAKNFTW